MKSFGGPVLFLDRNDINTDEIIPAKYLTEISKNALKPHLLEDLLIDGKSFDNTTMEMEDANVVVTRANFGCGSSREHAVWAFEVNDIHIIVAESFARIFRQNMFNCGILALELPGKDIDALMKLDGNVEIRIDLEKETLVACGESNPSDKLNVSFTLNSFDKKLIEAGGWLAYAEENY